MQPVEHPGMTIPMIFSGDETLFLDRTPAILGSAEAANLLGSPSEIVVDGEFLTRLDHTKAYVQNVTLHHTADQVGLATVIDDFKRRSRRWCPSTLQHLSSTNK
jgi:hypothetical protein